MVGADRALALVLGRVAALPPEAVALEQAVGRVLAADAVAPEAVPAFDSSAMDGYAVRAADTRGARPQAPTVLALAGESRAGAPADVAVGPGQAVAISTGGVLPAGADAVVRLEDTERSGPGGVAVRAPVAAGRSIRRAGDDIGRGERVLAAGAPIGPIEAGVLASLGQAEASCARRPRVAVLVTGDELAAPGEPLRPGAVPDANGLTVPALARSAGAEVVGVERVPDDPGTTRERLAAALGADVVVVCGGVSVGAHDHVRPTLEALGVEQVFWGVDLKPGKPTYFGVGPAGAPLVFGLPGNPVSAVVTFGLFAHPALRALQGADPRAVVVAGRLAAPVQRAPDRRQAVRCTVETRSDGVWARPTGPQGSHVLTSLLGATALAMVAPGPGEAPEGERVDLHLLPGAA